MDFVMSNDPTTSKLRGFFRDFRSGPAAKGPVRSGRTLNPTPVPPPYKSMLCAKSPAPVRPKPAPQVHNLLLTESSRSESAAVTIPVP